MRKRLTAMVAGLAVLALAAPASAMSPTHTEVLIDGEYTVEDVAASLTYTLAFGEADPFADVTLDELDRNGDGTVNHGEVVSAVVASVKDLDFGDQETFTLVGAGEEDYDEGRILVTSPLAQGLIGKKVGETVEIEVPAGTAKFEVLEIQHED